MTLRNLDLTVSAEGNLMNKNGGHDGAISLGSSLSEHLGSDSVSGVGVGQEIGLTGGEPYSQITCSKRKILKKRKNKIKGTCDSSPTNKKDGCLEKGVCSESRKISLETGLKQAETVASSVKEAQPENVSHKLSFVTYGDGLLLVRPKKKPFSEKDSDPNPNSTLNSGSLFDIGVNKLDHQQTPSQKGTRRRKKKKACDVSGGICVSNMDNEERNKCEDLTSPVTASNNNLTDAVNACRSKCTPSQKRRRQRENKKMHAVSDGICVSNMDNEERNNCEDLKRLLSTSKNNLTDAENACCSKHPHSDSLLNYGLHSGSQGGEKETSSVGFPTKESDSQLLCSGNKRKRQNVSREKRMTGNENPVLNDNILVNKSQLTCPERQKENRWKKPLYRRRIKVKRVGPEFQSSVGRLCIGEPTKKLLVLDLNGILVDVVKKVEESYRSKVDYSRQGQKVFKRPFCDDFINFCFERFNVGIWSSRIRKNVARITSFLLGDSMHKLVFCWDRSYCKITKLKTLEEQSKPLVLKELRKLWEKERDGLPWEKGQYNESNTILVDDSPYKALRNPAHNAIFPYPYKYNNDGDRSLGRRGDLRVYLEGLAKASNVQKYVEENPFGQPAITELDPSWDHYKKVLITNS